MEYRRRYLTCPAQGAVSEFVRFRGSAKGKAAQAMCECHWRTPSYPAFAPAVSERCPASASFRRNLPVRSDFDFPASHLQHPIRATRETSSPLMVVRIENDPGEPNFRIQYQYGACVEAVLSGGDDFVRAKYLSLARFAQIVGDDHSAPVTMLRGGWEAGSGAGLCCGANSNVSPVLRIDERSL